MTGNLARITPETITDCISRFRARKPHVHCITNNVAQNFTANVLLAAGAKASMTIAVDEIPAFVKMADALLINLGTMDAQRSEAIEIAVEIATRFEKPWALDPVFVQASSTRLNFARELLQSKPMIIRCNKDEMEALFECRFEQRTASVNAEKYGTCLTVTGATDLIVTGHRVTKISNGSPLMDRVTAMGCALNALMAGFAAVETSADLACASSLALFNLAGEKAESVSKGPGTFAAHFLDALANLSSEEISEGIRVS